MRPASGRPLSQEHAPGPTRRESPPPPRHRRIGDETVGGVPQHGLWVRRGRGRLRMWTVRGEVLRRLPRLQRGIPVTADRRPPPVPFLWVPGDLRDRRLDRRPDHRLSRRPEGSPRPLRRPSDGFVTREVGRDPTGRDRKTRLGAGSRVDSRGETGRRAATAGRPGYRKEGLRAPCRCMPTVSGLDAPGRDVGNPWRRRLRPVSGC